MTDEQETGTWEKIDYWWWVLGCAFLVGLGVTMASLVWLFSWLVNGN